MECLPIRPLVRLGESRVGWTRHVRQSGAGVTVLNNSSLNVYGTFGVLCPVGASPLVSPGSTRPARPGLLTASLIASMDAGQEAAGVVGTVRAGLAVLGEDVLGAVGDS
jgi:hypothetical protein